MTKITVKAALAAIRATGCTAGRTLDGEYRVNLPGAGEGPAYYTHDAADAIGTAQDMARRAGLVSPVERAAQPAQVGPDFQVDDQGSLVLFEPVSQRAKAFVQAFVAVPDYAWLGRRFAVEHGCADDLLIGITGNGLTVA